MKKPKKSKKSKASPEPTTPKSAEPVSRAAEPDYGGIDMSNFKKNLGCGS